MLLVGLLSFGLCSLVVAKFSGDDSADRFTTETVLLNMTEPTMSGIALEQVDPKSGLDFSSQSVSEAAPGPTYIAGPTYIERQTQVKPGDSLALIFQREGIAARELQRLLASQPLGSRLKSIFPGHALTFTFAQAPAQSGAQNSKQVQTLVKLAYSPGPLEALEFERVGADFIGREITEEPERTTAYIHATIDHSLFIASQRAGLNDALTMRLAQIFQWDIDFVLDIRAGDEFYILYEELFLGEEFVGYGDILAADFINQGDSYQALLYTDEGGDPGYYDPHGDSMRKAFLRAPVEFSRISSNFNLRRLHPLIKRTMPHRGIDYAAPRGTPILASGTGTVTRASRSKANGNFVVIKHGEQFVTKYLHLSKFGRGIRRGARVKQGQTIGYVGATGWATAPHLHYEFLVNGVHKNPRTVKLPNAAPIRPGELPRFNTQAAPLISRLESYKQQIQLAFSQ
jgi:murein DD-endopeptidase MepM/ murein hydrolase activator NlpD